MLNDESETEKESVLHTAVAYTKVFFMGTST